MKATLAGKIKFTVEVDYQADNITSVSQYRQLAAVDLENAAIKAGRAFSTHPRSLKVGDVAVTAERA